MWKDKFVDLIRLIKDKLLSRKDRDKYYDVSVDLYEKDIIPEETFDKLQDDYEWSKQYDNDEIDKDDFDLEI